MIVLIHGPAELLRAEAFAKISQQVAPDADLAQLNTTHLDGRTTTPAEMQNVCDTLPFLAEHRLVVVDGLLARVNAGGRGKSKAPDEEGVNPDDAGAPSAADTKGLAKQFASYLEQIPASTYLVLREETAATGALARKIQELAGAGRGQIITCDKPKKYELPEWIRRRAQARRITLEGGALQDLADLIGDDLRQIDQELTKLADYTGGGVVSRAQVRKLVAATRPASVFDFVDALGANDAAQAARQLRQALDVDGQQPLAVLGMIARQYRLLLQVKALQAQGQRPPEIARQVNIGDWAVPRFQAQAAKHSFSQLERALEHCLAADEAIKRGRLGDREALDVLLAKLLYER